MIASAQILQLHPQPNGFPWPDGNGELLSTEAAVHRVQGLLYDLDGLKDTTQSLAGKVKRLERKLAVYDSDDPALHPRGTEITALVERWKRGSEHGKATIGAGRVRLVKARLMDGFPIGSEQALPDHPTLELAVDGLCSHPYRVFDRRFSEGKPSARDDDFKVALKDEAAVEKFSRLGYKARRDGLVTWEVES